MAYNYIPVDLYPQLINQQNRSLRVTVYAPASPYGSLGCRPNQRFGCHQNTPQQPQSYNPPRSLVSSKLSSKKRTMDRGGKAVVYKRYIDDPNFRDNLEAILERLKAQEVTSPLSGVRAH